MYTEVLTGSVVLAAALHFIKGGGAKVRLPPHIRRGRAQLLIALAPQGGHVGQR
jgi:hypothetical protein